MLSEAKCTDDALITLRGCIQKVATGPEYSKSLSVDEAHGAMAQILSGEADPVQTAVFLIALRMKRETDDENRGILQALLEVTPTVVAEVDEVLDMADPYDGFIRALPASPFLPAVLAACGVASLSHGVETVGPKFGVTHRTVLRAAGVDVDLTVDGAARQLADKGIGWAYVDQKVFCPRLHALQGVRQLIAKRPCLTTLEVLLGPVRGKRHTHLVTGYVHKAYPRVYALLARQAGFDSAAIIRGVEGGIIPSLQQTAKVYAYHAQGAETLSECDPTRLGIVQQSRAVPLPQGIARRTATDDTTTPIDSEATAHAAARCGLAGLSGEQGAMRDSLIYAGAIVLHHLGRAPSLEDGARQARSALDSRAALQHFEASLKQTA